MISPGCGMCRECDKLSDLCDLVSLPAHPHGFRGQNETTLSFGLPSLDTVTGLVFATRISMNGCIGAFLHSATTKTQ